MAPVPLKMEYGPNLFTLTVVLSVHQGAGGHHCGNAPASRHDEKYTRMGSCPQAEVCSPATCNSYTISLARTMRVKCNGNNESCTSLVSSKSTCSLHCTDLVERSRFLWRKTEAIAGLA